MTETYIIIALFFANILLLCTIHETAHFVVARKLGLDVHELTLGIPLFNLKYEIKIKEDILRIGPLLIAAYVKIPQEEFAKISPAKRILVHAAGSLANLTFGIAIGITLGIIKGMGILDALFWTYQCLKMNILVFFSFSDLVSNAMGPIGAINFLATDSAVNGTPLIYTFIILAFALNLSLGIFNLLPIPPLDGGRIVLDMMEMIAGRSPKLEKIKSALTCLGVLIFIVIMFLQTFKDIMTLR